MREVNRMEELVIIPKKEYDLLRKKALRWDTYLEYETIVEAYDGAEIPEWHDFPTEKPKN